MVYPNINTRKGYRINFNKKKKVERNQRPEEDGLDCGTSFRSSGNSGEPANGGTVLSP